MPICPDGKNFISTKSSRLSSEQAGIITLIRESLFSGAQLAIPSIDIDMSLASELGVRGLASSAAETTIILPENDLLKLYPAFSPGDLRGVHEPKIGKVLLNDKLWCVETFVHETLHAVSVFANRPDLLQKLRFLMEGLTEFYTGYLLQNAFSFCYETCWRKDTQSVCHCTYQQQVKIWSSLCKLIPISETFRIYFWNGSTDWESQWTAFIQRVQGLGYPKFTDFLRSPGKLPTWVLLHQQCLQVFGRDYERNYSSSDQSLDLSSVKV